MLLVIPKRSRSNTEQTLTLAEKHKKGEAEGLHWLQVGTWSHTGPSAFQGLGPLELPKNLGNLINVLHNKAVSVMKIVELFSNTVSYQTYLTFAWVGVLFRGHLFSNFHFADDFAFIPGTSTNVQHLLKSVCLVGTGHDKEISKSTAKLMFTSKECELLNIKLNGNVLEQITYFIYLTSCLIENNCNDSGIKRRITKACKECVKWEPKCRTQRLRSKIKREPFMADKGLR